MHMTHKAASTLVLSLEGVVISVILCGLGLPFLADPLAPALTEAGAAVIAADRPPLLGPTNREEMASLVRTLSDPAHEARMFATRRLCAIGMEAREFLQAAAESADVEAALRAKQLLAVFDRLWFSGVDVSLSFSKPMIDWLEPVDLNVIMTNRLPYPARVPFDLDPGVRGEAADDARQVADMLDLAEWLKVRAPDGRELDLRVDDIGGEPAVFAVVQSRLAGGPGGILAPGAQITVTARAFNRGWARFPLLDRGEYSVMLDYVPDWTDEVLAASRVGRVISTPATVTIRDGAPPTVSRAGIQTELIVERDAASLIARLVNRTDQPVLINTNFGPAAPFADGRWVYELEQPFAAQGKTRRDLPILPKLGASWHDFKPELLVEVGPGESVELARISVSDLRKNLTNAGADLSGDRWSVHFTYANLCDRQWQTRQGSALLGNENAPPFFQKPLPRRTLSARQGSNRLSASALD